MESGSGIIKRRSVIGGTVGKSRGLDEIDESVANRELVIGGLGPFCPAEGG